MFSMLGVFVEFERSTISEKVKAGLAHARSDGKQLGRPRVSTETETAIRRLSKQGKVRIQLVDVTSKLRQLSGGRCT